MRHGDRRRPRRRLPLSLHFVGQLAGLGRLGRDAVFHVADEGLLQAGRAAVVDQLLRRVAGQHLARVHQRDAVAAHALVHEVRGDEDRHALVARKIDQQFPETVPSNRIDARGGLVEDQDLRLVQHRHRQRQPLPQAHGQRLGQGVEVRFQAEAGHQVLDALPRLLGRQVVQARMQHQVLADGHLAVQRESLRHVAELAPHLHAAGLDRAAEQRRRALRRRQQAGEHLHGGRLAAAVGAEEAEDLAALDRQGDVVDRHEVPEAAGQALGVDGDFGAGLARRDGELGVAAALFLRQQRDEALLQVVRAGALHQFGRRAGGQHLAVVLGNDPVPLLRLVHVGRGDHHAHAGPVLADVVDQRPELAARQRVDAGGGLIEDQQVRVVHQRAAQAHLLLHAAGQLARRPVREGPEAGGVEQLLHAHRTLGARQPEQLRHEVDVVGHAQLEVQVLAQALRHVGDARAGGAAMADVADVAVQHRHLPFLQLLGAGHDAEEGRLADAVGADDAHHQSRRDVDGDRVQRADLAVMVGHRLDADHGLAGRTSRGLL